MTKIESKLPEILTALSEKASLKQQIYRNTLAVFSKMKEIAFGISENLSKHFEKLDKTVHIEYADVNEFEFHLKFSGDLLMFTMHSNIIIFPEEHLLNNNDYAKEDPRRAYFGHIMCYNFMADSVKFGRMEDEGYLLGRMLVNFDNHFYLEGVRQLNFLFPEIAENQMEDSVIRAFIESSILSAVETDLVGPNYQEIQIVPLGYKLNNQMVASGQKVGFKASWEKH